MSAYKEPTGDFGRAQAAARHGEPRHRFIVNLTDEQLAAAEGWRLAHGITDQSEALAELVRLGLLSEIAKLYRLVSDKTSLSISRLTETVGQFPVAEPMTYDKVVQTD